MFGAEMLTRWEAESVALDEQGVSEAYFPLWGCVDVEEYLERSDAYRQQLARAEADGEEEAAEGEKAIEEDGPRRGAPSSAAEAPVSPSAARRFTWGVLFGARRVALIVLLCLVGTLILTLLLTPGLTLSGAIELFTSKAQELRTMLD